MNEAVRHWDRPWVRFETHAETISYTHTYTLLLCPYWLQSCWFNNEWCRNSKWKKCITASGWNTQVRLNGHVNTQSRHPTPFLFIINLTITIPCTAKTDTASDKCLHNMWVQIHVCPHSLWMEQTKHGETKIKIKIISLSPSARVPVWGWRPPAFLQEEM